MRSRDTKPAGTPNEAARCHAEHGTLASPCRDGSSWRTDRCWGALPDADLAARPPSAAQPRCNRAAEVVGHQCLATGQWPLAEVANDWPGQVSNPHNWAPLL